MKKILMIIIAIMMIMPLKANAFSWGDFFRHLFGISSNETVVEDQSIKEEIEKSLNEYIKEASLIDKDVQNAFISVVTIISGKTEVKTIKDKLTAANKKSDRSERISAVNQIINDYTTTLNNNKLEIVVIMKLLTANEQETLVKNTNIISEASQKYVELGQKNVQLASKTVQKATVEDERTTLLNNINKVTSELTESAKAATSLSRQVKIMAALSGIKF